VFQTHGHPLAHVPPERQGMLGPMTGGLANYMREGLIKSLKA
jgi:hypothetical protein